jgi:hypothetical protein
MFDLVSGHAAACLTKASHASNLRKMPSAEQSVLQLLTKDAPSREDALQKSADLQGCRQVLEPVGDSL